MRTSKTSRPRTRASRSPTRPVSRTAPGRIRSRHDRPGRLHPAGGGRSRPWRRVHPLPGVDAERLRLLLREICPAAGGTQDDWDTYGETTTAESLTAVLVTPDRV